MWFAMMLLPPSWLVYTTIILDVSNQCSVDRSSKTISRGCRIAPGGQKTSQSTQYWHASGSVGYARTSRNATPPTWQTSTQSSQPVQWSQSIIGNGIGYCNCLPGPYGFGLVRRKWPLFHGRSATFVSVRKTARPDRENKRGSGGKHLVKRLRTPPAPPAPKGAGASPGPKGLRRAE